MDSWISAEQAAERLGVKPATLYAYVSRGVLTRRRGADGRSLFPAAEIEQLARRGRPRRPAGAGPELVIRSAITSLGSDRQYYRGRDALDLARWCELEDVAALLWTDTPPAAHGPGGARFAGWQAPEHAVAAARAAQAGLPAGVVPLERVQVRAPALAAPGPRPRPTPRRPGCRPACCHWSGYRSSRRCLPRTTRCASRPTRRPLSTSDRASSPDSSRACRPHWTRRRGRSPRACGRSSPTGRRTR